MKQRAVLEVVTPHMGMLQSVPGGMVYTDQMLAAAGLEDQLGQAMARDDETLWLRRCLSHLNRRFHPWLRVRLVHPLSPAGFLKVIRYRIRSYPTFILGHQMYAGRDLEELEAFIRRQAGLIADKGDPS